MKKQVNFICDTTPTRHEVQEAIDYCSCNDCVARITYAFKGQVYHTMIDKYDIVEDIMRYISYIRNKY